MNKKEAILPRQLPANPKKLENTVGDYTAIVHDRESHWLNEETYEPYPWIYVVLKKTEEKRFLLGKIRNKRKIFQDSLYGEEAYDNWSKKISGEIQKNTGLVFNEEEMEKLFGPVIQPYIDNAKKLI